MSTSRSIIAAKAMPPTWFGMLEYIQAAKSVDFVRDYSPCPLSLWNSPTSCSVVIKTSACSNVVVAAFVATAAASCCWSLTVRSSTTPVYWPRLCRSADEWTSGADWHRQPPTAERRAACQSSCLSSVTAR